MLLIKLMISEQNWELTGDLSLVTAWSIWSPVQFGANHLHFGLSTNISEAMKTVELNNSHINKLYNIQQHYMGKKCTYKILTVNHIYLAWELNLKRTDFRKEIMLRASVKCILSRNYWISWQI